METTPDEIWSPDAVDPYQLVIDLAAMQQTVQDALLAHDQPLRHYSGTTAPSAGVGVPGDIYVHETTGYIYVKRSSGWERHQRSGGGSVSGSTDAAGEIVVTHGLGFTPAGVTANIGAESSPIPHLLHVQPRAIGATTFILRVLRRDTDTPFASNPVLLFWTAAG